MLEDCINFSNKSMKEEELKIEGTLGLRIGVGSMGSKQLRPKVPPD